ncbi:MAG TPA: hypothetical protein VGG40_13835 [Solirubrobacterales bacterium]
MSVAEKRSGSSGGAIRCAPFAGASATGTRRLAAQLVEQSGGATGPSRP